MDLGHFSQSLNLQVIEDVHAAAYRTTLGRSLYSPEDMVGKHKHNVMLGFWNEFCTTNRMAIVGIGVPHADLVDTVNKSFAPSTVAPPQEEKAKFFGGELRTQRGSSLTHASLVTEGAGFTNTNEVLALALAQKILGTGPQIKYGETQSMLSKVLSKVATAPFAVSTLNANYSDSGLFGVYVVGQPTDMGGLLHAALAEFRAVAKSGITGN